MTDNPIILFDGVCNFCNGAINFIITRDRKRVFRFAPLQSSAGQQLLKQYKLSAAEMDSFVLIHKGRAFKKTSATINVASILGGGWKLMNVFRIFPSPIRDVVYNVIANNRYRWWGKKDSCMIPTPEVRSLFLS